MAKSRYKWLALLAGVGLAAVFAAGAGAMAPKTIPFCGYEIQHKGTFNLTGNMTCDGSTPGIIIGTPGVTLNLMGHTISSTDSTTPFPAIDNTNDVGVAAGDGYDNVIVKNGVLSNWADGIDATAVGGQTYNNLLIGLNGADNVDGFTGAGIYADMHGSKINAVTVFASPGAGNTGILLVGWGGNKITGGAMNMMASANDGSSGVLLIDEFGDTVQSVKVNQAGDIGFGQIVASNKFFSNTSSGVSGDTLGFYNDDASGKFVQNAGNGGGVGFFSWDGSGGFVMTSNSAQGNSFDGFYNEDAAFSSWTNNQAMLNGFSTETVFGGGSLGGNGFETCPDGGCLAPDVSLSPSSVTAKVLAKLPAALAAKVQTKLSAAPKSIAGDGDYKSTWTNNTSTQNFAAGFYLEGPNHDVFLKNKALNNGEDNFSPLDQTLSGFYFNNQIPDADANNVSKNTSNNNAGWGFYSDEQEPGHANHAANNGAGECFLVYCS